ncbi:hypothetical protein TrispH2_004650 [Trichoplax sp. H2]|nr:hypothetical protein TrispH2_004650 [Trichoplax sp. H2]|eukprot:RDD44185.1 hypothetical protein TrispH2_004650 [Trichoplax sp. H2]
MSEILPKDLLARIFGYLKGWELATISTVCHYYNSVIHDGDDKNDSKSNLLWKLIVSQELTTAARLQSKENYRQFYKRIYLGPRKMIVDHCHIGNLHSTVKTCMKEKPKFNYSYYASRIRRDRHGDVVHYFDIILSYAARFGLEVLGRNVLQLMASSLDQQSIKKRFQSHYSHTILPIIVAADNGHYHFIRMLLDDGCRLCGPCVFQWIRRGPAYWIEERFVIFLLKIYKYGSPSLLVTYLSQCNLPDIIEAAIKNKSSKVQLLLKEQSTQSMDEVYKISSLFFTLLLDNKSTFEYLMSRSSRIDFWKGIYDIGKTISYMICADHGNVTDVDSENPIKHNSPCTAYRNNRCITVLQQYPEPFYHMLEEAMIQAIVDGDIQCLQSIESLHPPLSDQVENSLFIQLQEILRLSLNIIPIQLLQYGAPYHRNQLEEIIRVLPYLKRYKSTMYDFEDVESMISLFTMLNYRPFCAENIAQNLPFYHLIQVIVSANGSDTIQGNYDSLFSYVVFTRCRPIWNDLQLQNRYNQVTTCYLQAIIDAKSDAIAVNKVRTVEGKTLLHMAAESNNPHWIQCLLSIGADPAVEFGPDRLIALNLTQCKICKELLASTN